MVQGDLMGMAESETARGTDSREPRAPRDNNARLPGIQRDDYGKPRLPIEPSTLYAFGHLIRSTEQLLLELFTKGLLSGTTHTCLGQELCQMAVVRALDDPEDVVLSNHRNHGHFLTYSGDFHGLVSEIMGREAGVCKGIGGSQHLAYRQFHSNGVQAGMTGMGVGLALAQKLRARRAIVACFIGDGTLGEGLTYESLNLASVWRVPMLFVVENNGIAQTTKTVDTIGGSILARGAAFGLHTWHVDDSDPAVFEQVEEVVRTVRSLRQPGFLVIETMRLGPHSKGDDLRDDAEMAAIRARDPLSRLSRSLPSETRLTIERRNVAFIDSVRELGSASPESRFDAPPRHVFSLGVAPASQAADRRVASPAHANVRSALNGALRRLLTDHPEVLLLGEDLHDPYGGAFKVTTGLSTDFPDRVISTPISEAGVVGAAIGLALAGYRPIAEIMFADFLTLAMDQIYNHAVKFPGMFEGMQVPLVVRTPSGGRRGYGPTHSQSPESLMTAVPGLTVLFPSHRHDAGRLLEAASLEWGCPTVFFEHKLLYGVAQDQADYEVVQPAAGDPGAGLFPTLVRRRADADLTIVAYGGMLPIVEQVAAALTEEDLAVEIVAPSLLQPLPRQTLVDLLIDRPRIAVIEESPLGPGFGSELGATLLEHRFRGRLTRLAPPPVPIPAARSLESSVLLDERRLFEALVTFVTADDHA
jgi:2-oxoisovalerate dehydrogenase E1 component